ncbi:MAG: hypothetical protein ACLPYS_15550 [Vulcanimicrobiaceae bacterium]
MRGWLRCAALFVTASFVVLFAAQRPSAAQTVCVYDPNSATPNPFGMRAYLSFAGDERSAVATYDVFPSNEPYDLKVQATLEERRRLKFYNLGLSGARRYLAAHPEAYHDVIGDEHPEMSYPEFDKHLSCKPGR